MAIVSLSPDLDRVLADRLAGTVLPGLEATLQPLIASPDDWLALLSQVFSAEAAGSTERFSTWAEQLRQELSSGGFSVSLELRSGQELQGANAAYAAPASAGGERILLNADWAAGASNTDLQRVLLEELGHAFDQRLTGGGDTPGDEGALFAARLLDIPLEPAVLEAMSQENDGGLLQLGNQAVPVEFNGYDPSTTDTDQDGVVDSLDLDDDNDGILDTVESLVGDTTPLANTISFSYAQTAGVNGVVAGFPSRHDAAGVYGTGDRNDPKFLFDGDLNTELRVHNGDIFEFNLGQTIRAGSTITLFEGPGSNDAPVAIYASLGTTDPAGNTNNATGGGKGWANLQAALTAGTAVLLYTGPSSATQTLEVGIDVTHVQIVGLGTHGGFAEFTLTASIDTSLDTDGDGIPNSRDLDSDNDGISDLAESVGWDPSAAVMVADANRDGTIDLSGNSFDASGVWTKLSAGGTTPRDSDNDGIFDFLDLDSDADGIPDTVELQTTAGYLTNDGDVSNEDADGDGVIARFDSNDASGGTFGGTFATPVNTDASGEATSGGLVDISGSITNANWVAGGADWQASGNFAGQTFEVLQTRYTSGTDASDGELDNSDDGYAKLKSKDSDNLVVDFGVTLEAGTVIVISGASNQDPYSGTEIETDRVFRVNAASDAREALIKTGN
jgi:hypothetical protein